MNSQMRSVSAFVRPSSTETTTIAARPTATSSAVPSARAANQAVGSPSATAKATGEPNSQKRYGRALAMPRS